MIPILKIKQGLKFVISQIECPLEETYTLFIHNNRVGLYPVRLDPKSKGFIVHITSEHIENGFSPAQWGAIIILTAAAIMKESNQ